MLCCGEVPNANDGIVELQYFVLQSGKNPSAIRASPRFPRRPIMNQPWNGECPLLSGRFIWEDLVLFLGSREGGTTGQFREKTIITSTDMDKQKLSSRVEEPHDWSGGSIRWNSPLG